MEKIRRPLIGNSGETRLSVEITKENARILYFAEDTSPHIDKFTYGNGTRTTAPFIDTQPSHR